MQKPKVGDVNIAFQKLLEAQTISWICPQSLITLSWAGYSTLNTPFLYRV